jgi:HTH-type transcriptional regulator / antitoxin HigA
MIAAAKINPKKYGKLLAETLPTVIETEEENERMLTEIHKLMLKGDGLSPEEEALLELMSKLVEGFEEELYPIEPAPPHEVLRMLMEDRGVRQRDLLNIFGSSGIASEVVNGKRSISKAQALALGKFFNVSAELFLWGMQEPEKTYKSTAVKRERSAPVIKQLSLDFENDVYVYTSSTRITAERSYSSFRQKETSRTRIERTCVQHTNSFSGVSKETINGDSSSTLISLAA